ncbi:similar to RIKEN cDNA 2810428I15 (predicted), isoform CRA_a, partial [Rattus norvegicus]
MPNLPSEGGSPGTRGRREKRPMASGPALTASWLRSCPAGLPSNAPHAIKNSPSAA